jgi:hypothetical protein
MECPYLMEIIEEKQQNAVRYPGCAIRPKSLHHLWEGIAKREEAEPNGFLACTHRRGNHEDCCRFGNTMYPVLLLTVARTLHSDAANICWLLNRRDKGWGEYGYRSTLERAAERLAGAPALEHGFDEHGEFVEVVEKETDK